MVMIEESAQEGDTCNEKGCTGRLSYKVEGCTCFQVAPCSACENATLYCSECEKRKISERLKEMVLRREALAYVEAKGW